MDVSSLWPAMNDDNREVDDSELEDLHEKLALSYKSHAAQIEATWRSLDGDQRAEFLHASSPIGKVPKNADDWSLGTRYFSIMDWNISNIAHECPERLLHILRWRTQTSLFHQIGHGCPEILGSQGDSLDVVASRGNVRSSRPGDLFPDTFTIFSTDNYRKMMSDMGLDVGYSIIRTIKEDDPLRSHLNPLVENYRVHGMICVPVQLGAEILVRQRLMLLRLSAMIDNILAANPESLLRQEAQVTSVQSAEACLSKVSKSNVLETTSISELSDITYGQADILRERLEALTTIQCMLFNDACALYGTLPGLLADEKGRIAELDKDKHRSYVVFEAFHNATKEATIWKGLHELVKLLAQEGQEKLYRSIILQEIANVCQLGYEYVRGILKRSVQFGSGRKCFHRLSNIQDGLGDPRVVLKVKPQKLMREDVTLYYLVQLCLPNMSSKEAAVWINKLLDVRKDHVAERQKLLPSEIEALGNLALTVSFLQDVSQATPLPPPSKKKGCSFVTRWHELDVKLREIKLQIDLTPYAVPMDNLMISGTAEAALRDLNTTLSEKTGSSLSLLYHEMVEASLSQLKQRYHDAKAKLDQTKTVDLTPLSSHSPQPAKATLQIRHRREKEKTRPEQPCGPSTPSTEQKEESISTEVPATPTQTFRVSAATAEVFSNLFCKTKSRGSIAWSAFESAMAELGFSVVARYGSVHTFFPPASMNVSKSLTLHRPHQSHIEGHMGLFVAQRLQRVYGWGEETFSTSS